MSPEETAQAAKAEAFFAKLPDPPVNTLVEAAEAHAADEEGADEPSPKGRTAPASTPTPGSTKVTTPKDSTPSSTDSVADRVLAALKAGDLDTLADLTDQDPAGFDEKSTKWAAKNRKETKLKEEVSRLKADATAIVEHWEPIDDRASRFAQTKDYTLVKEMVELLTGEDWDSVSMKTFRAVRGNDPRVPELAKVVAAKDAELGELRTKQEKAADRALREALRDDLPSDHQVRKVPEWEDRVAKVLRDSIDPDTGEPELSFKQAAARVVRTVREEYQKYAGVFGDEPRPAKTRSASPERAAGSEPSTKRKLTREEYFASFSK
jgi:hypothetical protein